MILVVLPKGGCWWTLSALQKYGRGGGGTYRRQSKGVVGETREEMVEDRKITDLPVMRE